jgi:hypothetical protein
MTTTQSRRYDHRPSPSVGRSLKNKGARELIQAERSEMADVWQRRDNACNYEAAHPNFGGWD